MSALSKPRFTPQQYLERERFANFKSEFLSGEIFAMAGASEAHNLIVTNVIRELSLQFKGRPCRTYPSDMKVETGPAGLFTYPDVSVVCEKPQFHDDRNDMLLNPTLIVEVLSPSTEDYDRDAKFAHYRRLNSLTDYLLISSHEFCIEHYVKEADGQWTPSETTEATGVCTLASIGCRLEMSEVYDRVEFRP
jgi:Uma2 family endonuclease